MHAVSLVPVTHGRQILTKLSLEIHTKRPVSARNVNVNVLDAF